MRPFRLAAVTTPTMLNGSPLTVKLPLNGANEMSMPAPSTSGLPQLPEMQVPFALTTKALAGVMAATAASAIPPKPRPRIRFNPVIVVSLRRSCSRFDMG